MSSLAVSNGIGLVAETGFGIGTTIERLLKGHQNRVRFVRGADTLVEFDLCISQSHKQEATPSAFPIESAGQVVCDNVLVPPPEVTLTGMVSDNPLGDSDSLRSAAITTASSLVGPAGVAAQAAGAYLSQRAQDKSERRSLKRLNALRVLAGAASLPSGSDGASGSSVTPKTPQGVLPFTVIFPNFTQYDSMAIKSLECQLDSSTGDALVFTVTLTQIKLVQTQTAVFVKSPQAAKRVNQGVKDTLKEKGDKITKAYNKGVPLGIKRDVRGAAQAVRQVL